jgi:prevent-host-death family protein
MKVYSVSLARAHLSDLLDAAEKGEQVVIERRGIRHAITVQEPAAKWTGRRPQLDIADDAVEAGTWNWSWNAGGIRFRGAARRRK